jgi:uncharacterized membrane protein
MIEGMLLLLAAIVALPVISLVVTLVQRNRQSEWIRRTEALERRVESLAARLETAPPVVKASDETQVPRRPAPAPAPAPPPPPVARPAPRRATPPTTFGWKLEQQFGTRAAVWLGAVALALAGAFLVKYSIDQGLIGPAARVTLGLVFGAALVGAAEWLRTRSANVAQGLAASGIAVLYAALLAGTRLYGLFPDLVGALGMALTTAIAVVLATRHGPIVAILGLLGGFLTPILIGSETPRPWMLLFYLLLLQTGLSVVSRRMRWSWVAAMTQVAALGWCVLWLVDRNGIGGGTFVVGLFLLGSIASNILTASSGNTTARAGWDLSRIHRLAGTGVGVILMGLLVGLGDFGWIEWTYFAILGTGCLVLAAREKQYESLPWFAAAVGAVTLFVWGTGLQAADHGRFWMMSFGMLVLYVGGAYGILWRSNRPDRWATLAGATGIVYLLVAYAPLNDAGLAIPWGVQAVLLAAIFAVLAVPVHQARVHLPRSEGTLAALVIAATALLTLAVPIEFERQWIGVVWSLEIPALVWLAGRLRLRQLVSVASLLGGLVAARLLLNPWVLDYPTGSTVLLNWTLYGYGVPAAMFVTAARLLRGANRSATAGISEAAAPSLGLAFLTLNVRLLFHPGRLDAPGFAFAEIGAYTVVWGLYAILLLGIHRRFERPALRLLAIVCSGVALAQGLLCQALTCNPLFTTYKVGSVPIFNSLLLVYGAPAAVALWSAHAYRRIGNTLIARIAGVAALVFAFLTLTLEVRQAFHGSALNQAGADNAEMYTYSLVWILFATALLVAGIVTRGAVLRYGSAAVMLLAVGKVFLLDLAHLQDLYRVFSLFGLGVSLMLLAYLYQRFVFGAGAAKVR